MRIRSLFAVTLSLSLSLSVALLSASAVSAQSSRRLPVVGTHAVMFSLPEGGGAGFGIRKMRSAATNVGLEVQVGASRRWTNRNEFPAGERNSWSLGLSPDVRLYRRTEGPVVPFLEWQGGVRYAGSSGDAWLLSGSLGAGLGVEWFPLDGMSISGATGVAGTYARSSSQDMVQHNLTFGAFRSQLTLNLYF